MKRILTVIGTRPEAIKLEPVIRLLSQETELISRVCVTYQHTDLLKGFLSNFTVDYALVSKEHIKDIPSQTADYLMQLKEVLKDFCPDLVLVQGDTTTAFVAALSAFYARIPVAHIEAGLRTGRWDAPWPEERHRELIDCLATYFFASTTKAKETLIQEGVAADKIWVVGNTVIDAVRLARTPNPIKRKEIIVTVHRRENHGKPLLNICQALLQIAHEFPHIHMACYLHPNPQVRYMLMQKLSDVANIELVEPATHTAFIQRLDAALFAMTDSGGIQEEATFLGKPLLVMREITERPEGVAMGTAKLVGTQTKRIVATCRELIENSTLLAKMSRIHFPYGDGHAAERIVQVLREVMK